MDHKKRNEPPSSSNKRVDFQETLERNFITPGRAISEFLLKPSQLEGLPKNYRRSPYGTDASLVVYNRKDVQKKAIEVWGSLENLERERKNFLNKKYLYTLNAAEVKKMARDTRRSLTVVVLPSQRIKSQTWVVFVALLMDILNFVFKLLVWYYTNYDSMMAETVHSFADSLNQAILVFGLWQIAKKANSRHPYGYSNTMYVASLISGVGIFCLGSALSLLYGIIKLTEMRELILFDEIKWAFVVLGVSATTDFVSFSFSVTGTYKDAKHRNVGFFYYAFKGFEPGLTVIIMEDFAAFLGNVVAASMLAASWSSGSSIPDAVGCTLIGILLGIVALFLIVTNSAALVGRSISSQMLEEINQVVESDVMIRAVYDVKGIDMGNNLIHYKAEIDFDGAELTRFYLDHLDLQQLLEKVKEIDNVDNLEEFMITHGENISDLIGGQIDRIENRVRSLFPQIRHMDLEIV